MSAEFEKIVLQKLDSMEADIKELKQDVAELKQDVTVLKEDVAELKQDVTVLKEDVAELKQDVTVLKQDVAGLKTNVTTLKKELKEVKEDGTLDEICDKYFGGGEPAAVESAKLDESKDQLVVATNAAFEPFEYTKGDKYVGIDMELAALLAEKLGKELVIQNMDFDAVCLSVGQHKCDIAIAGLTVNDERKQYVTFSDTYYQASQRLIVPSDDDTFDDLKDADAVAAKLGELKKEDKIGVQQGTTAQSYIEGDEAFGFEGLPATCQPYKSGSLAVQDMLNGNIKYVIIDAAPATAITEAINAMQ